jgi:hypothetical protein
VTWARLDDQAWHSGKLLGLSPGARLLWVFGLSFVASGWPENDGCLAEANAIALARMHGVKTKAIAELVELEGWERLAAPDRFHIHDIERYLPPRTLSKARSEAGKLGARVSISRRQAIAEAKVRQAPARALSRSRVPSPVNRSPNGDSSSSQLRIDVQAVWDAWVESTGSARSKLDEKRQRLIRARLKEFKVGDLVAAVKGWRHDPWPDRARQNGIEILLRDAAHVEKFRDLEAFTDLGSSGESTSSSSISDLYWQRQNARQVPA